MQVYCATHLNTINASTYLFIGSIKFITRLIAHSWIDDIKISHACNDRKTLHKWSYWIELLVKMIDYQSCFITNSDQCILIHLITQSLSNQPGAQWWRFGCYIQSVVWCFLIVQRGSKVCEKVLQILSGSIRSWLGADGSVGKKLRFIIYGSRIRAALPSAGFYCIYSARLILHHVCTITSWQSYKRQVLITAAQVGACLCILVILLHTSQSHWWYSNITRW